MENRYKKNLAFLISSGASLILLLLIFLFGTKSTDFTCIRSLGQTECTVVQNHRLLSPTEIKIHSPIAVDINECDTQDLFGKTHSSSRYGCVNRAEIRSKGVSYKINIYSGQDRQAVHAVAKEINEFLLSSNAPSFHKRF
jgi:hypothetical protein